MVVSAARRGRVGSQPAVFHGWWIVLVAFLCFAVNTGLIFYAWSIFLVPLATAFGGHARVAGAYSTMQAVSALAGLWVGRVVDRRGARPVEIAGTLLLVAGFLGMSQVRTLPQLYCCMAGPIALGSTCIAGLPNNAAVARWFVRKRGRALGISTAGISAGGIVFAPLAQFLTVRVGWRAAYALLGGLVAVLLLPPFLLFMRRDPADLGLLPDGERTGGSAGDAAGGFLADRRGLRALHGRALERAPLSGAAADRPWHAARACLPRAQRDGSHGSGWQARLRGAPRPLRSAAGGGRVLLPPGRGRAAALAGPQPRRARLLRRALWLRDGRQRDAAREPRRRGVRPAPLRGDQRPAHAVRGRGAGAGGAGNRLAARPHRELWTGARARRGGGAPRRGGRAPDAASAAAHLARAGAFAYVAGRVQGLVIRWLVSALALWLTSLVVKGIEVHGVGALFFAAATIGILNAIVRPVILLLTLPLNVLTLGLFTLVVNAAMIKLAADVVRGFEVRSFWSALGGWLLLSLFTFCINLLIGENGRIEVVRIRQIVRY